MACGTLLIAFVPGYATIGLLAPLLVLIGRPLQGFSAGVELGGVSVYLAEMATPGNKGFYVSWQSASQQVAIMVAAALGFALNRVLTPADVADWGWRIPFAIGCLIVPFLFYIRRSLEETEEFRRRKSSGRRRRRFRLACRQLGGSCCCGVAAGGDDDGVVLPITVYTPTFGRQVLNLSSRDSLR